MSREIITKSAAGTKKIARRLSKDILQKGPLVDGAVVIALTGELGGGKTTFVQGFARALGVKEKILSPTFVILKKFTIYDLRFRNLIHVDAYRLDNEKEILTLGWEGILRDNKNIIIVEWADRVQKILPKQYIHISFEFVDEKTRKIKKDVRYS